MYNCHSAKSVLEGLSKKIGHKPSFKLLLRTSNNGDEIEIREISECVDDWSCHYGMSFDRAGCLCIITSLNACLKSFVTLFLHVRPTQLIYYIRRSILAFSQ